MATISLSSPTPTPTPYREFQLSQISLGPYLPEDIYFTDWFKTTRQPVPLDSFDRSDRQFEAKKRRAAKDTTVSIPPHLDLTSPDIKLAGEITVLNVCKFSPWLIQCQTSRDSDLAQFLIRLSDYGQVLLRQNSVQYGKYWGFVFETGSDCDRITFQLHGNQRLNHRLTKSIGKKLVKAVIRPRAIWRHYTDKEQIQAEYDLVMMVSLIGCEVN